MLDQRSKVYLIIGILFLTTAIIYTAMNISYDNEEIRRYVQIENKYDDLKNHHDNTWKTIKKAAKVPENYKNTIMDIYSASIENRKYGGEQMKLIVEDNPEISDKLWVTIQEIIKEEQRNFTHEQTKFLSMKMSYHQLTLQFPANYFIDQRDISKFKIITSTHTEEVFKEGKDDDISIFN